MPLADQPAIDILSPFGYQSGSCGYCKDDETSARTPDSRASYYVKAKQLAPESYQILMDRGWRRSGQVLYLPDNRRSCCPHYTIRLPTRHFKPSRDQRQTLNRWNRFILGESFEKDFGRKHAKVAQERRRQQKDFELCTAVHASETEHLYRENEKPLDPIPAHQYEVTLEEDSYSAEKFALYKKYQVAIHQDKPDEVTASGFKRFLCASSLMRTARLSPARSSTSPSISATSQSFGAYHQLHRLDGQLVALSVIDILPRGISAVYFIYDPEYHRYGLGKVSALREASLAIELGVENYYMGYYIHGCPKMRYKGEYRPQYVLDLALLNPAASGRNEDAAGADQGQDQRPCGDVGATGGTGAWRLLDDQTKSEMENRTFGLRDTAAADADADAVLKTPVEAAASRRSLLSLGVPGVTPLEQVLSALDLGDTRVSLTQWADNIYPPLRILSGWYAGEDGDEDGGPDDLSAYLDASTLKGIVVELAAAVGVEVARGMVISFG